MYICEKYKFSGPTSDHLSQKFRGLRPSNLLQQYLLIIWCLLKAWNHYSRWYECPQLEGVSLTPQTHAAVSSVAQGSPHCGEAAMSFRSLIINFLLESELQLYPLPLLFTIISACNTVAHAKYNTLQIFIDWMNYLVCKSITHLFWCRCFMFTFM